MSSSKNRPLTQFNFPSAAAQTQQGDEVVPAPQSSNPERPKDPATSRRKIIKGPKRDLTLTEAVSKGARAYEASIVLKECPWDKYWKVFDEELAGSCSTVIERSRPSKIRMIRSLKDQGGDDIERLLQIGHHENLVFVEQCFHYQGFYHIVHEHLLASLDSLVACSLNLGELQMASIIGQVTSSR